MTTVLTLHDELIREWCCDEMEKDSIDRINPPCRLTINQKTDDIQVDDSAFELPRGKYKMVFDSGYLRLVVIRQAKPKPVYVVGQGNRSFYYVVPMFDFNEWSRLHLHLRHGEFESNVNETPRYNCDLFTISYDRRKNRMIFSA